MIADYFINPLQGQLFKLFCDLIMGYKYIGEILEDIESTDKYCVGNQNKVTDNPNLKIMINVQFYSKYKILTQVVQFNSKYEILIRI